MRLQLEGKLFGPYVGVLDGTWQFVAPLLGPRKLVLDLCDVLEIDRAGKELLSEIHRKTHAEFVANSALTKYFAQEAMQEIGLDTKQGG